MAGGPWKVSRLYGSSTGVEHIPEEVKGSIESDLRHIDGSGVSEECGQTYKYQCNEDPPPGDRTRHGHDNHAQGERLQRDFKL